MSVRCMCVTFPITYTTYTLISLTLLPTYALTYFFASGFAMVSRIAVSARTFSMR
jgi:hypothetical protein